MLKIFNDLKPFFQDNYKKIHVREYAKIQKISPPTSSKILENLKKEGILKKEIDKKYNLYYTNKDSEIFRDLQRIYYKEKLSNLVSHIKEETINPVIILFGSTAKNEIKEFSDIDLAIITPTEKKLAQVNLKKM